MSWPGVEICRKKAKFISWALKNALLLDPAHEDCLQQQEKLAFLDRLLEGKRIVYLGEEDHWIHEKYYYRRLFLKYLFSRGWRYIGEELSWSDGERVNRYLQTGADALLDRVVTYGYQGAARKDRDDKPEGILGDTATNYPLAQFAAEQRRLAIFLRNLNETAPPGSKKLHYFGFDIDLPPGAGYEDIEDFLQPIKGTPGSMALYRLLEQVPGETMDQELSRLNRALTEINDRSSELEKLLGDHRYARFRQSVLTLRDSVQFARVAYPARDWKTLNMAMASREEAMCRHVEFILSTMQTEDKLVLMGHNRHLAKDSAGIKKAGGAPPGGKRVPALGTYLNRLLPGQIFSIWMLHAQGSSSQPYTNLSSDYGSPPGILNSLLAKVGDCFILPTTGSGSGAQLLRRNLKITGIYNDIFRTAIARQADALFFMRRVSPLPPVPGTSTLSTLPENGVRS